VQQVLSVHEGYVSGHNPADGTVLWSCEWPSSTSNQAASSQPVVLPGNRLLLTKGYAQGAMMVQIEQDKGQWQVAELWRNRSVLKTKFTNVAVKGGSIIGLSESILECVDAETGERQWKGGRYGYGQLLLVGDLLLVQADDGRVVMLEASGQGCLELGEFPAIEGKSWGNLCLWGPYLLVRNAEQAACYKLPLDTGSSSESDQSP
jgi:outer membrane protein assembly factor BamB